MKTGRLLDAVLVALAVLGQAEVWIGSETGPKLAAAGVVALTTLPLLGRHRFPLAAPLVVFAGIALPCAVRPEAVRDGASATLLVLLIAFWVVGAGNEWRRAVAGAAAGFATIAVLAVRAPAEEHSVNPPFPGREVETGATYTQVVFLVVLAAGIAIAAYLLRSGARRASVLEAEAARLEREREEEADAAVASERLRIARDLHDVIVQGVSVMTVQAGAARVLLDEGPGRAREPLLVVEEAGRQTLAEARRLLGVLRTEEGDATLAPRPGLATIEKLVAQARGAGLQVEFTIEGRARPLQAGVELAAYRIVQDALTGALARDEPAPTGVTLRYDSDAIEVEVASGASDESTLVAMHERVAFYGGELDVRPDAIRARFPLELDAPQRSSAPGRVAAPSAAREGPGVWSPLRRHAFDALVVVLAVVSEIEIAVTDVPGPTLVLVPAVLLWSLPLLWRRRYPFAAPVCSFAAQAASSFAGDEVGGDLTGAVPLFLAFWALGAHANRRQAVAGALAGFAGIVVIANRDVRLDADAAVSAIVICGAITFVAYALRRWMRRAGALEAHAARIEQEREERARAAVAAERRRIARDLHDVLAHSVSVMTVQAGAARMLLDDEPERARAPLLSVEETGRQTLGDMRRLLGIMPVDEGGATIAPRAGLAALGSLLTQVRTAGLPVELAVEGEPCNLPPGLEVAVYRIVQEALTNARKHGAPARADVALRYGSDALEVEITNDGRFVTSRNEGGHGLVGMRERVALYGGVLDAGPRGGGGFAVRARLPVETAAT